MPRIDWKIWVRSQVKIDRLEIKGPAEHAADLVEGCANEGWHISGMVYETVEGVQSVKFVAERELTK